MVERYLSQSLPVLLTLHPLGIIQRGPATYLVAMANDYEDTYLYALHRMKSAEQLDQDSRKKENFNISDYASRQGHFGSSELIEFKVRICDHLAKMLEETPLTDTQQNNIGFREISTTISNRWQLRCGCKKSVMIHN